eukprot:1995049-Amphidinium_carterae.1
MQVTGAPDRLLVSECTRRPTKVTREPRFTKLQFGVRSADLDEGLNAQSHSFMNGIKCILSS